MYFRLLLIISFFPVLSCKNVGRDIQRDSKSKISTLFYYIKVTIKTLFNIIKRCIQLILHIITTVIKQILATVFMFFISTLVFNLMLLTIFLVLYLWISKIPLNTFIRRLLTELTDLINSNVKKLSVETGKSALISIFIESVKRLLLLAASYF